MTRKVELYGRLRDLGHGGAVSLELAPGATARQALAALKARLGDGLKGCALASADDVLSADDKVPAGRLAVLPPVCGG